MMDISKYHFSGERVLLNSVMDIHCSTAEGGLGGGGGWGRPKSDGCTCEGGNLKFLIWALYISKLS